VSRSWKLLKMSGAGNDFVVLGPEEGHALGHELPHWTRKICRRGLSVGADGVLVVEPVAPGRVLVKFLNPDGGEAFCGNGSRCAARYAFLRGFAGQSMVLLTHAGEVPARVAGDLVRLTLRSPEDRGRVQLEKDGEVLEGRLLHAGVPHLVAFVEKLASAPLASWGPWIRRHPRFDPEGTNVDFVEWRPDGDLGIRTWERGVEGETLACGSGALAAAALVRQGQSARVRLVPASGVGLVVEFASSEQGPLVVLEGDARVVLDGFAPEEAVSGFPTC
jgi:diaminopimelate epimerase